MSHKSQNKFVSFGRPHFTEDEIEAVAEVMSSGAVGTGERSNEFQSAFAHYQGAAGGQATSSCTAALLVSLRAFGIGPGDEVIIPAMTYHATANAVIECGARPIIVDVEPRFGLIDLNLAEKAINSKTRAIIPVHLSGAPVSIDDLATLRKKYGVRIVHDCAHAIETEWNGKKLGSYDDVACYSFFPTKNMTTFEGGMMTSNNNELLALAGLIVQQGMSKDAHKRFSPSGYKHFDVLVQGFKFNLTDIQAAVGLQQLRRLEERYARRKKLWEDYQSTFKKTPVGLPPNISTNHRHAHHLFRIVIVSEDLGLTRDEFMQQMQQNGVGCGVHYRSLTELTYFQKTFGLKPNDTPNALEMSRTTLSLPFNPYLTATEIRRVKESLLTVIKMLRPNRRKVA